MVLSVAHGQHTQGEREEAALAEVTRVTNQIQAMNDRLECLDTTNPQVVIDICQHELYLLDDAFRTYMSCGNVQQREEVQRAYTNTRQTVLDLLVSAQKRLAEEPQ